MGLYSHTQLYSSSETMLCFILEEDTTTMLSTHVYHLIALLLYPCLQITLLNQPVLYLPSYYFNQLYSFIKIKTITEKWIAAKRRLAGASVELILRNLFHKGKYYILMIFLPQFATDTSILMKSSMFPRMQSFISGPGSGNYHTSLPRSDAYDGE